jgi:hypothetical protein
MALLKKNLSSIGGAKGKNAITKHVGKGSTMQDMSFRPPSVSTFTGGDPAARGKGQYAKQTSGQESDANTQPPGIMGTGTFDGDAV